MNTTVAAPPRKLFFPFRVIRGFWRALDFSRRFVFNLIFLVILVAIFIAIGKDAQPVIEKTALVVNPEGAIVEQYTVDPFSRMFSKALGEETGEVQLRDIVRAIDVAAKDGNIQRLVIVPDGILSVGMAQLHEIAAAIGRFRATGKPVIAFSEGMDQRGYFLAAQADKVYLDPDGGMILQGLERYRTYFKDGLDKLGIEMKLFRVGEFKSAGEPYILNQQSPEARAADLYWMNDVWQRYLAEVGARRKLTPAVITAQIESSVEGLKAVDGDLAKYALANRWVDALKTRDEFRKELIAAGAFDKEENTFRQVHFEHYARQAEALDVTKLGDGVAVVVAQGEIVYGDQPPGLVGGESVAQLIEDAREDEHVKALVLRVDSPGGGVFPSEQIRRQVALTKAAGKPVIVSMGNVAASGGYWISMNADQIVADPSTITGSIGIFGLIPNAVGAMDKLGLNTDGVGTTWLANAGDPTQPWDPRVGELIQTVINNGYAKFVGNVAVARNKTVAAVDEVARGRVWTGEQARARGLVDRMGTLREAIAIAGERAKLGADFPVRYVEKDLSPFERFVTGWGTTRIGAFIAGKMIGTDAAFLPERQRAELAGLLRMTEHARTSRGVSLIAHCECAL